MKKTIYNQYVNVVSTGKREGMIFKRDLARLYTLGTLHNILSILGPRENWAIKAITFTHTTDNFKVKIILDRYDMLFERNTIMMAFAFRNNGQLTAYGSINFDDGYRLEVPNLDYPIDSKVKHNDGPFAILFNRLPNITNRVELKEELSREIIPKCKSFVNYTFNIYDQEAQLLAEDYGIDDDDQESISSSSVPDWTDDCSEEETAPMHSLEDDADSMLVDRHNAPEASSYVVKEKDNPFDFDDDNKEYPEIDTDKDDNPFDFDDDNKEYPEIDTDKDDDPFQF